LAHIWIMKLINLISSVYIGLLFLLFTNCDSDSNFTIEQQDLDKILIDYMEKEQVPGLVYLIAKNGKPLYQNALGIADLRHGTPCKMNTVFEIASVTKQFSAAAILLLQEEGKLELEDNISKYVPKDCPEFCAEITIKQLLNHTSGLPGMKKNWDRLKEKYGWQMEYSNEHWMSLLEDGQVTEPGEQFIYSDLGYYLIGLIISNASGVSSEEYLISRFFNPLEMDETYIDNEWQIIPNESDIYRLKDGHLESARRDWSRTNVGNGGLLSTAYDLLKWNNSLRDNTILSKESTEQLFKQTRLNNGAPTFYGLGWTINETFGLEFQMHSGASGVKIIRIPELDYFICVLTNRKGAQNPAAGKIIKHLLKNEFPRKDTLNISVNPELVKDYLGTYEFPYWKNNSTHTTSLKEDTLILKSNSYTDYLIPYKNDQFLTRDDVDGYWRFQRNETGEVIGLWWESYVTEDNYGVKIN